MGRDALRPGLPRCHHRAAPGRLWAGSRRLSRLPHRGGQRRPRRRASGTRSRCWRRWPAASPPPPRLLTLARIAADYGARGSAVQVLETLLKAMGEGQELTVTEPFWPPLARYETVPVGFHAQDWLRGNIVEALERLRSHSSAFAAPLSELDWLCAQPLPRAKCCAARPSPARGAARPLPFRAVWPSPPRTTAMRNSGPPESSRHPPHHPLGRVPKTQHHEGLSAPGAGPRGRWRWRRTPS